MLRSLASVVQASSPCHLVHSVRSWPQWSFHLLIPNPHFCEGNYYRTEAEATSQAIDTPVSEKGRSRGGTKSTRAREVAKNIPEGCGFRLGIGCRLWRRGRPNGRGSYLVTPTRVVVAHQIQSTTWLRPNQEPLAPCGECARASQEQSQQNEERTKSINSCKGRFSQQNKDVCSRQDSSEWACRALDPPRCPVLSPLDPSLSRTRIPVDDIRRSS